MMFKTVEFVEKPCKCIQNTEENSRKEAGRSASWGGAWSRGEGVRGFLFLTAGLVVPGCKNCIHVLLQQKDKLKM